MPQTETPGFAWRGPRAYWIAPRKAVLRGYIPRTIRLPDGLTADQLADLCRTYHQQALAWLDGKSSRRAYDGTFGSLIDIYQTHKVSPFHRVKWLTRHSYTRLLKVLRDQVGTRALARLTVEDFHNWYWGDPENGKAGFRTPAYEGGPERATQAHHLMTMVRMVIAFGVVALEDEASAVCGRLASRLKRMTFPRGTPRKAMVTAEHVADFAEVAHELGRPSMALAFALQFECGLRQRDVIGEMTPDPAAAPGPLSGRGKRWTTGLLWGEHLDPQTLVLRKPTSKSGGTKAALFDLTLCPLAAVELARIQPERRIGPVVISEHTGQPYDAEAFRRLWRRMADLAGIPADVCNMHARHGAENEAKLAGANPMHIRNMMTHADLATTLGYDQATLEETRAVAELRARVRKG